MGQSSQAGGGYGGQAPAYGGQPAAVTTRLTRTQVEDSLGRLFKGELLVSDHDAFAEASTVCTGTPCLEGCGHAGKQLGQPWAEPIS